MVLLGINCGFGQGDISSLPKSAIDFDGGWIDWADSGLAFLRASGERWVRTNENGSPVDGLGHEFSKLLKQLDLKRVDMGFYCLRHGFQTVAEESRDMPAVKHVMGHSDDSMGAVYRERISDERLKEVTDVVRTWLWPKEEVAD